jgi:hypothetical protein
MNPALEIMAEESNLPDQLSEHQSNPIGQLILETTIPQEDLYGTALVGDRRAHGAPLTEPLRDAPALRLSALLHHSTTVMLKHTPNTFFTCLQVFNSSNYVLCRLLICQGCPSNRPNKLRPNVPVSCLCLSVPSDSTHD